MVTHGHQYTASRLLLRMSFSEPASGLRAQLPCRWVAWASCSPPFQRYLGGQARSGRHESAKDRWQATSPRTLQGPRVPEAAAKRRFLNPAWPGDLTQQSSFIAAHKRGLLNVLFGQSNEDFRVVGSISCAIGRMAWGPFASTRLRGFGDWTRRRPRHNNFRQTYRTACVGRE